MVSWNDIPSWLEIQRRLEHLYPSPGYGHFAQHGPLGGYPGDRFPATDLIARRVRCTQSAFHQASQQAVISLTRRFADLDIYTVIQDLVSVVTDMAMILVGSAAVGGIIGGGIGGLGFGVGAGPGDLFGAGIGLQAGNWILAILGLKSVAEFFVDGLPTILGHYQRGISIAWSAPKARGHGSYHDDALDSQGAQHASAVIATAHEAVITLLLGAIATYLTRGRGNASLLAADMSNSRRGSRLAQWMLKHEEGLKKHPSLKPREPRRDVFAPQEPPLRRHDREPSTNKPIGMPQAHVPCFSAANMPTSKIPEFDRQLAGQEKGLNNLTVREYLEGRSAFESKVNVRNPVVAADARRDFRRQLENQLIDELIEQNTLPSQAEAMAAKIADEKMKTLAALHNPDLFAGGKDKISGFGDRQVNSSIGPQWRSRLKDLDRLARDIPEAARNTTKINAPLVRCK